MFAMVYWFTSYDMLLGCTPSSKACHTCFFCMICYTIVAIFIGLHEQKWINKSGFELFFTCIESHIFVPDFSISHIFLSIIKFFCCLLVLGQPFTVNIEHSNKCIQHNLYTIFEKIYSLFFFIFSHTWLQGVVLITREVVLSSIFQVKRMSELV